MLFFGNQVPKVRKGLELPYLSKYTMKLVAANFSQSESQIVDAFMVMVHLDQVTRDYRSRMAISNSDRNF